MPKGAQGGEGKGRGSEDGVWNRAGAGAEKGAR